LARDYQEPPERHYGRHWCNTLLDGHFRASIALGTSDRRAAERVWMFLVTANDGDPRRSGSPRNWGVSESDQSRMVMRPSGRGRVTKPVEERLGQVTRNSVEQGNELEKIGRSQSVD
jgi:hypothetical protein